MQLANCKVRLMDDLGNEIPKTCVTPAEVLMLQREHGQAAVVNITPLINNKRTHANELRRLVDNYGAKKVAEAFPGAAPRLPVTFEEIGFKVAGDFMEVPEDAFDESDRADDTARE